MATQINISSKYQGIISKTVLSLQSSGPPAVYQLKAKKEKFGTLTRVTVGEKNPHKPNKTILLVGETGAGKSTLINALLNYSMGVKFEDDLWFQIVEEEKRNQTETQTTDVIVYEIFGFEDKSLPYSLTIIDTPGYGDTRGIEHDVVVSQRLFDLFRSEDGVHELHAVGLVLHASVNRLSDRLIYIFDSMMSLFGKNMEENIVAVITNSDGVTPDNAIEALETSKIRCAKDEDGEVVHFMFNNRQNKQRTQKNTFGLEQAWKVTDTGLGQFSSFLDTSPPKKVNATVEVMNTRVRLTACIQNLQDRITLIELKQTEIQQIQNALKKHKEEMKKNEKFTLEYDEVYKEKEPIHGGMWGLTFFEASVCCTVCEENCHYPGCTMAWKPEHCEVMRGGRCTVCSEKCPASDHVKEKWIYVTKTRKVTRTEDEIRQKYEENKAAAKSTSSLLGILEGQKKTLENQKSELLDEPYQHIDKLEQIALNVNSVSTYVHLDFLIEKMKEKGDTKKVQKLEEMKKRDNKRIIAALMYMHGKLTGFYNAVKEKFSF